jgi:hypothetical protein
VWINEPRLVVVVVVVVVVVAVVVFVCLTESCRARPFSSTSGNSGAEHAAPVAGEDPIYPSEVFRVWNMLSEGYDDFVDEFPSFLDEDEEKTLNVDEVVDVLSEFDSRDDAEDETVAPVRSVMRFWRSVLRVRVWSLANFDEDVAAFSPLMLFERM